MLRAHFDYIFEPSVNLGLKDLILARTARSVFRGSDSPKAFIHYRSPSSPFPLPKIKSSTTRVLLLILVRVKGKRGKTVDNRFPEVLN